MSPQQFSIKALLLLPIIILLLSESCLKSKEKGIPPEVLEVLNVSGIHKPQLNKFIIKTLLLNDTIKLDAAYFIVSNLSSNYTAYYTLEDSTGQKYKIEPEAFESFNSIRYYLDSIQKKKGKLKYEADSFAIDYTLASAEFLQENLQYSFSNKNKNYLNYDLETFKRYILPFKIGNEEIEFYQDTLFMLFNNYSNSAYSFEENIETINNKLNSIISYDKRYIYNKNIQSVEEILQNKKASLEEISIFKTKVFRSLGYAATMDYSPVLADSSGSYAWTVVISPQGIEYPLDVKNGILSRLLNKQISKIFRRTYFTDSTSLYFKKETKTNTPPYLGHYNQFDVTDKYINTLNYKFNKTTNEEYQYLAVFNDGKWKPVDWAEGKNKSATFKKLGPNLIYLPVLWIGDSLIPHGEAFLLQEGNILYFNGLNSKTDLILSHSSPTEEIKTSDDYKLYLWNGKWIQLTDLEIINESNIKAKVPENSLLLLTNKDSYKDERIFIVKDGKQIFY